MTPAGGKTEVPARGESSGGMAFCEGWPPRFVPRTAVARGRPFPPQCFRVSGAAAPLPQFKGHDWVPTLRKAVLPALARFGPRVPPRAPAACRPRAGPGIEPMGSDQKYLGGRWRAHVMCPLNSLKL